MEFNQWLQSRLTAHGFPVGGIDGVIGPITIAAIKAFQLKHRIRVSGLADAETVAALRLPSSPVPQMPPKSNVWPTQKNVPSFFGEVGKNTVLIDAPYEMRLAWDRSARIKRISVHKLVADSALRVLQRVEGIYSRKEREDIGLDVFGGCLNVRRMRGGTEWSMHSWAIAMDFDPERNQLNWGRDKARLAQSDALPFWEAWEAEGWVSLGRTRNYDWMHVQAARL